MVIGQPMDLEQLHCNENPIHVFLFWELLGLSPNFHIHVSVSDLYISRIGPHIRNFETENYNSVLEIRRLHSFLWGNT
jgi:hypothetical protein